MRVATGRSRQLPRDQSVERVGGIEELLVRRVPIARFHLGDEPSVVAHLGERGPNRGPIVVAEEDVGVDTLIAAAAAMLQHVLYVNARDPRTMHLDPLLGEAGVVDVADVEVNADGWAVDVVQELRELAWAEEKALLGVAVLAADPDTGARGGRA